MLKEVEELIHVQELLRIEKEEDFNQYKEKVLKASINSRKNDGLTWYPVIINSSEYGIGEYLVLEIERTTNLNEVHQFSAGKSVSLFSNAHEGQKESLNGVIKYIAGNKLKLALLVDELPDWADEGKLGIDLLFDESSYREMEIAMHKVINAEKGKLAHLRSVLYGSQKAKFDPIDETIRIENLNESQNRAVQNIDAARDVAIIHGPPGTGKTTTLVEAIRHTLQKERQVLVCSPSNVAVDLLTEKLAQAGVNVLRLGNPARVSEELIHNTLDAKVAAHPYYKDVKNFTKRAEEFRAMARKYKRNFGRAEKEQRQLLYDESKSLLKEARHLEEFILDEQFTNAQVITCTPVNAASRYLRHKQFQTAFIDEAAQALEPMTWIIADKADRLVFAGDHFQLPPTVKSKRAETGGLKKNLFEKCIERQKVDVMLDTQYRMNELIMNFSNNEFYRGELKAHESVRFRTLELSEALNAPVDFIDTAGCGYTESLNPETLSNSNPEEASLLLHHLKLLMKECREKKVDSDLRIGIISPYKEQVQLLTELVAADEELKEYQKRIAVKTIDGFQGQEKDIIYISLVRSNETGEIGFLNDTRRMNVGLTRAKKKLVVIGDSSTLGYNEFYKRFLEYIESIGAYKSAWEFIS